MEASRFSDDLLPLSTFHSIPNSRSFSTTTSFLATHSQDFAVPTTTSVSISVDIFSTLHYFFFSFFLLVCLFFFSFVAHQNFSYMYLLLGLQSG